MSPAPGCARLCLCIHIHQPVGNFDHVMEGALEDCYLPMLRELERHPGIRCGLHVSGCLLEWMESERPEVPELMARLCSRGDMELLTSGRYEPVITLLERADAVRQIRAYSRVLQRISGREPGGLWLTERVWEPHLASLLAEAGVGWAVVDDLHLRLAGVPAEGTGGVWVTEDAGRPLRLLGSSKRLRYMIPFSPVDEVIGYLLSQECRGRTITYGDDGEKFGVWPGTAELCYGKGWLGAFLTALLEADGLETVLPSEAAAGRAEGPVYIPAASYEEMGEWTMTPGERELRDGAAALLSEAMPGAEAALLLRGGFFRNYLSRYPESAELRGRVMLASGAVDLSGSGGALRHLWRSQCNCSYWHGVFGGLYMPHLREALWRELTLAETEALLVLDSIPSARRRDLDHDGMTETVVRTERLSMTVRADLSVTELTPLRRDGTPVPMGHVLTRHREAYHDDVGAGEDGTGDDGRVRTIHDGRPSKEAGLAELLVHDAWRRRSMTDLLLGAGSGPGDWEPPSGAVATATVVTPGAPSCQQGDTLRMEAELSLGGLPLQKSLTVDMARSTVTAESRLAAGGTPVRLGMELCICLMTDRDPERYMLVDGGRRVSPGDRLCTRATTLEVRDSARGASLVITAEGELDLWTTPLDTVSMSEGGFERVHQGVAMLLSRVGGGDLDVTLRMEPRT